MKKLLDHHFLQSPLKLSVIFLASLLATYSSHSSGETPSVTDSAASNKNETLQAVPFITLRNKTGSDTASEYFGGERNTVHAGYCELSSTSLSSLKSISENVPFYIPEDIVTLYTIREVGIEQFWKQMKDSPNGRHPTLYTHGFNIDFEKGCRRAALFQKSYDQKGRFLYFSWPSDGAITNYMHDEADLYWSVEPLRQTLSDMIIHFGESNINVVAHSLGTRGVLLALVLMAQAEQENKPLLNQLVLIAPDIDAGVFKQYLPLIKPLAKRITIYVSANDSALLLSRQIHGYPRLGEPGAHLAGLTGIEIIDISNVPVRFPSGHIYHLYHNVVVNDLGQLLNGGKPAAQRSHLKQSGEHYWQLQPLLNDK